MNSDCQTTVLFRPVGPDVYPLQNEQYAIQIARDGNAKNPKIGAGFVTRFRVQTKSLNRLELKTVGSAIHREYWIPAQQLPEFHKNIVGKVEVIVECKTPPDQ